MGLTFQEMEQNGPYENYHEWTDQEVREYMKNTKDFFSRFDPSRQTTPAVPSPHSPLLDQMPQPSSTNFGIKSEPSYPTKTLGQPGPSNSSFAPLNKGPQGCGKNYSSGDINIRGGSRNVYSGGIEGWSEEILLDETEQLLIEVKMEDVQNQKSFAKFGEINGAQTVAILRYQSVFHTITKADVFNQPDVNPMFRLTNDSAFTFNDRYTSDTFQGIMPDSGAAGVSTVGAPQCAALQRLGPSIQVDTSTAGKYRIRFGKGEVLSQGTVRVPTPLGHILSKLFPPTPHFYYAFKISIKWELSWITWKMS
ncbi:integrase and RNaseH domain-containing protein [Golovinomyces cichoracearum]|uniref:Integrase and RNaseH domain-containing protein n=1 Tax=Golovinomyces cichoracearum TaxID=62708 RepID=A0A420IVW6_9PEZI|nr:integrase and RNaseH domain-containing protein [Golovinomyces cichoracearum]